MIRPPDFARTAPISPRVRRSLQSPRSSVHGLSRTTSRTVQSLSPNRNFGTKQAYFHGLVDAMTSLTILSREFLMKNNISLFDPAYSEKFSRLMNSFQSFCQQSGNALGVGKSVKSRRMGSFLPSSQFYKNAEKFSIDFMNYAKSISSISSEGVFPYRQKIDECFRSIHADFNKVRKTIRERLYSSTALIRSLTAIENELKKIHNEFENLLKDESIINREMPNKTEILNNLNHIAKKLGNFFVHELPSDVYNERQSASMRNRMVNTCAEISDLIQSMERFPRIMRQIKNSIYETSKALQDIFYKFRLPFSVTISRAPTTSPQT